MKIKLKKNKKIKYNIKLLPVTNLQKLLNKK